MTWFNQWWSGWVTPEETSYAEEQKRLEEERRREERQKKLLSEQEAKIQEEYFGKKQVKKAQNFEGTGFMESMKIMDDTKSQNDNLAMVSGWARQEIYKKQKMEGMKSAGSARSAASKAEDNAAETQKEGAKDMAESDKDAAQAGNDKKKMQKKKANQKKGQDGMKQSDGKLGGIMGNENKMQLIALNTLAAVDYDPNNPLAGQIQSKQQLQQAKQRAASQKRSQASNVNQQAEGKKKEVSTLFKQATKIHKMSRDIGRKAAMGLMMVKMGLNRIKGQMAMLKMKEVKADMTVKKGQLTQTKGLAVQAKGVITQAVGKAIQLAGKILAAVGRVLIAIGQALCSNPFTAAAGAALISLGTKLQVKGNCIMQPKGMATEAEGKATEASGKATETSGKATEKSGQIQKKSVQMRKKRLELQKKRLEQMKKALERLKKMADKLKQMAQKIRLAALAAMGKAAAIVAAGVMIAQEALADQAGAEEANMEGGDLAEQGKEMMKNMKMDYQISDDGSISMGMTGGMGDQKMGLYMGENGRMAGSYSDDDMSLRAQNGPGGFSMGGGMAYDNDGDGDNDGTFGFNAGSGGFGMNGSQIDDDGSVQSWGVDSSGGMSYGESDPEGNAYNVGITGDGVLSYEGQSVDRDADGNITAIDRYGVTSEGDFHTAEQTRRYETYTDENGNKYTYLKSVDEVGFQKQGDDFGGTMGETNFNKFGQMTDSTTMGANSDGSFNYSNRENQYNTYTDASGHQYSVLSQSDAMSVGQNANGVLGFATEQQRYNERGQLLTDDRMGANTLGDGYVSNATNQYDPNGTLRHSETSGVSKFGDTLGVEGSETNYNQFGQMTDHTAGNINNHGDFGYTELQNEYNMVRDPNTGQAYSVLSHADGLNVQNANGVLGAETFTQDYNRRGQLVSDTRMGANTLGDGYIQDTQNTYDRNGTLRNTESMGLEKQGDVVTGNYSETDFNRFGQMTDHNSIVANNQGDFDVNNRHNDYKMVQDANGQYYSQLTHAEGLDVHQVNGVLGFDAMEDNYNDRGQLTDSTRVGADTAGNGYLMNRENDYDENGKLRHSEGFGIEKDGEYIKGQTDEQFYDKQGNLLSSTETGLDSLGDGYHKEDIYQYDEDGQLTQAESLSVAKQGDKIGGNYDQTKLNEFGQVTDRTSMGANSDGDFHYTNVHNDYNKVVAPDGQVYSVIGKSEGVNLQNVNGVMTGETFEQNYNRNGQLVSDTRMFANTEGDFGVGQLNNSYDANGILRHSDQTGFRKDGDVLGYEEAEQNYDKDGDLVNRSAMGINTQGDAHVNGEDRVYETVTDEYGNQRKVLRYRNEGNLNISDGEAAIDGNTQFYNSDGQLTNSSDIAMDTRGNAAFNDIQNTYDANGTLRNTDATSINKQGSNLTYEQADLDYNARGQLTDDNRMGVSSNGDAYGNSLHNDYYANGNLAHSEAERFNAVNGDITLEGTTSDYNTRGQLTDRYAGGVSSTGDMYAQERHLSYYDNGQIAMNQGNSVDLRNGVLSGATDTTLYDQRGQMRYHDDAYMNSDGAINVNQQVINPTGVSSSYTFDKAAGSDNARMSERNVLRDQNGRTVAYNTHDADWNGYERTESGDRYGNLEINERNDGQVLYKRSREVGPDGNVKDIALAGNGDFHIDNYDLNSPRRESITGVGGDVYFGGPTISPYQHHGVSAYELAAPYSHNPEMWDTQNLNGHYTLNQPDIVGNARPDNYVGSDLQKDLEKYLRDIES